jgi:multidrug efflux pump
VDFPTISVQAVAARREPRNHGRHGRDAARARARRIAGVTEITSSSSLGSTRITLQFDLTATSTAPRATCRRDQRARTGLPTGLPSNPTYRKVNPADAPIMILALTRTR